MSAADFLAVALVCALGAMSPGPSLALVLRHALGSSGSAGFVAATMHAVAIGIYALATALGLALVLVQMPGFSVGLQLLGSGFLLYLGTQMLRAPRAASTFADAGDDGATMWRAARDGFLVAFLNPKIMLFFGAVFSPFVRVEAGLDEKLLLAGVAFGVDWVWFMLVVVLVSRASVIAWFQRRGWLMDRAFGVLLIGYGVHLAGSSLGGW